MTATPGKFVYVQSGTVFDGWEENGYVGDAVTKGGHLPGNRRHDLLPYWYRFRKEQSVTVRTVARYDPDTEAKAALVRARLIELADLARATREELSHLYDYQAGPAPAV